MLTMKKLLLIMFCFAGITFYGKSQSNTETANTIRVILENDHVKVTEYVSNPGQGACGLGKHSHPAHL